jgi:hypothetical protein
MGGPDMPSPTPSTAAVLMQSVLEPLGWEFWLNERGQFSVTVGDDLPGLPQQVLMAALGCLAKEFEALVAVGSDAQAQKELGL